MRRVGVKAMTVMKEIPESMGHISCGDQERSELEACQADGGEGQRAGQLDEVRAWPAVARSDGCSAGKLVSGLTVAVSRLMDAVSFLCQSGTRATQGGRRKGGVRAVG
jgi:hypothetical protein